MLKSFINRFAKPAPAEAAHDPLASLAPTKGEPGTRVHHEYFVMPAAEGYGWVARVYAQNSAVNEESGVAANESLAREQALAWCANITAVLKGI